MKRLVCMSLALILLLSSLIFAQAEVAPSMTNETIFMRPGDSWECPVEVLSSWQSNDTNIVSVEGNTFTAHNEGFAVVLALKKGGGLCQVDVTVDATVVPSLIREAIELALSEWEAVGGARLARSNKYTLWYSNGNKYEYGWCAAFECWCLYHAGIPMVEWGDTVPHSDDEVWSVKANGVGKVIEGFHKMNRLTFEPRPGYLVVYGKKNSGNSMHVGLITEVTDLRNGKYLIKTVEGNMSNTVKRYCYEYDMSQADESRANEKVTGKSTNDPYPYKVYNNYYAPAEEYQTEPEIYKYDKHEKDWYVFRICATWY